jgi:hypothetical protein
LTGFLNSTSWIIERKSGTGPAWLWRRYVLCKTLALCQTHAYPDPWLSIIQSITLGFPLNYLTCVVRVFVTEMMNFMSNRQFSYQNHKASHPQYESPFHILHKIQKNTITFLYPFSFGENLQEERIPRAYYRGSAVYTLNQNTWNIVKVEEQYWRKAQFQQFTTEMERKLW